ncbi:hypothetical protein KX816_01855 [Sphingosinicellaceae bacterium]|nr:hypothetical protein KX816_01855 [Sphingosinicellaceae bacterium]
MIMITDISQLAGLPASLERLVGPLLKMRVNQLASPADSQLCSFARFLVVEAGDSMAAIDAELGFPVRQNLIDGSRFGQPGFEPSWEWIQDHGGFFELVFVMTDDGFAHVVLVLDNEGVDRALLSLCRHYSDTAAAAVT